VHDVDDRPGEVPDLIVPAELGRQLAVEVVAPVPGGVDQPAALELVGQLGQPGPDLLDGGHDGPAERGHRVVNLADLPAQGAELLGEVAELALKTGNAGPQARQLSPGAGVIHGHPPAVAAAAG